MVVVLKGSPPKNDPTISSLGVGIHQKTTPHMMNLSSNWTALIGYLFTQVSHQELGLVELGENPPGVPRNKSLSTEHCLENMMQEDICT